MDTGFNYYHGADPSEYDLVLSNSEGGLGRLLELGARRAEAVLWAADPEFFRPLPVEKDNDVFFYGYGDKFRREWMRALVGEPSRRDPRIDFALGGRDFQGDVGRARLVGDVPFNVFARAISAARVNLNVTRRAHATVDGSSTCRPFELAAAGRGDRLEPPRRASSAGSSRARARRRGGRRRRARGVPRAARRPGRGGGDGRARTRARPRRAHLRPPGAPGAAPARARGGGSRCERPDRGGRAGVRRGGRDRRGRRRDPRRSTRRSTSSSSTTAPATRPRRPPRRRARPSSACRSTSASAPPCRRASATRSSRTTTWPSGSTATASTTRPSCRSSSSRSSATRPTSSPGSRFREGEDDSYRPPLGRRLGITWFATPRLAALGQRVTDTTSGFQALNRQGIALFAATIRATTPRSRRRCSSLKHRLRLVEVPVGCASASTGSSSITFLRSIYYAIKVTLALFIAMARRYAVPSEEVQR